MAKRTKNAKKVEAKPSRKRVTVKRLVEQAKEPLSLLETLKEEGMARAVYLLSVASMATRNIKKDKIVEQVKEGVHNLGLVSRADFERLEARVEELEASLRRSYRDEE